MKSRAEGSSGERAVHGAEKREVSSILFEPLNIGSLQVAGRVFKSATSETRASPDGHVTEELLEFYRPLAAAGTPLIVTGNLFVSRVGKSGERQAGASEDAHIPGLTDWAQVVHRGGATLFGQLNHCGRQVLPAPREYRAVSASAVQEKLLGTRPRALRSHEIAGVVTSFADAAVRCQRAGFDGVQIHAGHGYLLSQFLTPYTNRRRDDYGGTLMRRSRLLREVHREIRQRVGWDFPVILKMNGADLLVGRSGLATRELVQVGHMMQEEGIDGIEVTVGHYESGMPMVRGRFRPFFAGAAREGMMRELPLGRRLVVGALRPMLAAAAEVAWPHREGFNLPFARAFRTSLRIPVICVGGFRTRGAMERAIETGGCDAVSVARAMIANPHLYAHLKTRTAGPLCDFCNGCIARAGCKAVDCYDEDVRRQKDAMLSESKGRHMLAQGANS